MYFSHVQMTYNNFIDQLIFEEIYILSIVVFDEKL